MNSIFDYLEYRDYLRDHYNHNKNSHRFFSFRYISNKTGLDASFYVKVLNKQKHISDKAIPTLIAFFHFNKREGDYFTHLVHFNKAKNQDQEMFYFEKMLALRKPAAKVLDKEMYEYFSTWWNIALREQLNIMPYSGNAKDLAARLLPPITEAQAKRSVKLLHKLGMIHKDAQGTYRLTSDFVTTNGMVASIAVRSFQKEMIRLSMEALDRVPVEDRDISTLTISTSRECLDVIREKLGEIRREIMELVRKEEKTDEVFQLNFQIFPLTQNRAREKK
ncbi:MAG: TIGR02147 family protein [Chitinispirillaceae bacterium]|nr:TIGR02147 family protein [Chitinispirillaceae bacterium]